MESTRAHTPGTGSGPIRCWLRIKALVCPPRTINHFQLESTAFCRKKKKKARQCLFWSTCFSLALWFLHIYFMAIDNSLMKAQYCERFLFVELRQLLFTVWTATFLLWPTPFFSFHTFQVLQKPRLMSETYGVTPSGGSERERALLLVTALTSYTHDTQLYIN